MKDYNQQEWRERLDTLKSPGDYFEDDYVEAQESAEENTDCGTGGANYRLRALDYWLRELEEQREIAATERTRIDSWLESQERRIQKRIDWCETTLRLYLEGTGKKSMSLPYGKLQRRVGRERIEWCSRTRSWIGQRSRATSNCCGLRSSLTRLRFWPT